MRRAYFLFVAAACSAVLYAGDNADKANTITEQGYVMSLSEAEHLGLLMRLDLRWAVKVRMEGEGGDSPNVVLIVSAPQYIHDGIAPFVNMLKEVRESEAERTNARMRKAIEADHRQRRESRQQKPGALRDADR